MIGIWGGYADEFLIWLSALTFVLFTIPLLLVPLRWAKLMGFQIPAHTDLAVYFGRSVGALAAAMNFAAMRAGLSGAGAAEMIGLIIAISAMMVLIHAWGAYKKIQPLSETLEIGFWIAMGLVALAVLPAA
ncbi:MAG: hypothetical protein A3E78_14865 [Alphaproteobacteria bacterium RIFCSPHIGHO2_12_FULL_63_12]|nr:MAG: hypothetical protein A3E78_14865 [Alphaproteobacteria bacterium RIFCSPHIGHO2_12_FULL_63_12]